MFIPVYAPRFPLDRLLAPFLKRHAPAALISAAELLSQPPRPDLPLWVDSGGYAAFDPRSRVVEEGGMGVLVFPDGQRLSPQDLHTLQSTHAQVGFTLDFPGGEGAEKERRLALSYANARFAFSQPRAFQLYASVQPDADLAAYLVLKPDGVALGGLAPYSRDLEKLKGAVCAARAVMPAGMPLHVFGIGRPESIQVVLEAGATSVDSSAPQRQAASAKGVPGPSPAERVRVAVQALKERVDTTPAPVPTQILTPVGEHPSRHALEHGFATEAASALITWPTASGKTYAARQAAQHVLDRGQKVIILVPLKALAAEIAQDWQAEVTGIVEAYTSDRRSRTPLHRADVIVMTPERLDLLTRSGERHRKVLSEVGLLIADEFHLIRDPHRGARLDGALTKFRLLNPTARVLLMTATCGNPAVVQDWLGGHHYHSDVRPVPLHWESVTVKHAKDKRAHLQHILQVDPKPTLIFVHSRTRAAELGQALPNAAAHHAGLTPEERQETEARYRAGEIRHLVCTPTLEMGLNLPAKRVVLHDLTLYSPDTVNPFVPLGVNAARQRAGRAGRQGEAGEVVVLGTKKEEPERYEVAPLEPLQSPLLWPEHYPDFLLGAIDGRLATTKESLTRLSGETFAVATRSAADPEAEITELLTLGALEEMDGQLRVTTLGRLASRHLLPVRTVLKAQDLPEDPTAFDVLLLAASCLERPLQAKDEFLDTLFETLDQTSSRILDSGEERDFKPGTATTALVVLDACEDGDREAAQTAQFYPPEVTQAREALGRIVTAWHEFRPEILKLQLVRVMLSAGVGLEASTLALLPGIGGQTARKLAREGILHAEDLAQSAPGDLSVAGIREARAARLIEAAQGLIKGWDTDPTREPPPGERELLMPVHHPDPMRLARARTLTVTTEGAGFRVTGGQSPHVVQDGVCDCPDQLRHRDCKHVLAVKLWRGELKGS